LVLIKFIKFFLSVISCFNSFRFLFPKAILGSTLGSEVGHGGGNRALGEVHERNEQTIAKQDAAQLADTLRLQLFTPMVRRTFGPNAPVPYIAFDVVGGEDLKALADRMKVWRDMGGPIGAVSGANALAIPNLEDGEPILGAATPSQEAAKAPDASTPAPIAEPPLVAPQEPAQ
jgi:phage gp29-like protein